MNIRHTFSLSIIAFSVVLWGVAPHTANAATCWLSGLDYSYAPPGSTYQGVTPPSGSTCLPAGSGAYGNFNEGWGIRDVTPPSPTLSGTASTINFTWTGVGYYNASQLAAYTASSNWPQTWADKFYIVDSSGYKRSTSEGVIQKPTVKASYAGFGGYNYYLFYFPVSITVNPPSAGTYYVRSNYVSEVGGFGINTYAYLANSFSVTDPNTNPNTPTISGPTTGVTSTSYTYSFRAADSDGDQVRYRIDWDNNGSIDQTSGWVNSNTSWSTTRSWSTAGTYTFKARTQDDNSAYSGWRSYTVTISNPTPQCSDGIDNDGDGLIDTADYGCSNGTDTTESPNPQCSDGADNDGDGDADYPDDFGCLSAADTTESPNPQCSDGIDNDGNTLIDLADPGCEDGADNNETAPEVEADVTFTVNPALVRVGNPVSVSWSVTNVSLCTIAGSNGDSWTGTSGSETSLAITAETTFVIACEETDGDSVSMSATVRLVPSFEEVLRPLLQRFAAAMLIPLH